MSNELVLFTRLHFLSVSAPAGATDLRNPVNGAIDTEDELVEVIVPGLSNL